MSKRFKGGDLCAYCSKRPASTADHIFARKFFLESARANLPQAPSCEPCNNEKSKLENYVMTVVPFGGQHADALETLAALVPGRLSGNRKLHRQLAAGHTGKNIPFDGAKLEQLFTFIARGLLWFHWKVYLRDNTHSIRCFVVTPTGTQFFNEQLFSKNSREHVNVVLGIDTIRYEGKQAVDDPALSIWRFSVYGGLVLSENAESGAVETRIIVITGPKAAMNVPEKQS